MAQSGQYNYERCIAHNEFGAARLALFEFVNAAIHVTFLFNEVYMPFYKWKFRAMRDLYWPKNIKVKSELNYVPGVEDDNLVEMPFEQKLETLLSATDEKILSGKIKMDIDQIARLFLEGLSYKEDSYLEKHAYEVNNKIKDNDIRNASIFLAV